MQFFAFYRRKPYIISRSWTSGSG